ncbi:hypothetical protein DAEQUDRAFT_808781 [Daedalea quercina L-15889]|uniref:Ima1 N-terminal domain-containing protein n=1 Tax=Daedalea quercina L-15889 TaxID=1314783 RepID=A0A165T1M9_9APHY|nr:hypothetical protein DAEQUDRAFT_808781 [Daedalea quercina L-15889]
MSTIFKPHNSVTCFFCQSIISPIPRNPHSFRCPHCDCWNRFDANGEILSDEPAMHEESLNAQSFARRASPRKDRLPSMYASALFCRTCQTNQMLLANLLSNYLPPPDHPDFERRADMLPEYKHSIEARYPPVCADCAPAVEEEIRRRDNMARARALGGFLGASNPHRRRVTRTQRDRDKLTRQITFWKVRGCLWLACLVCTLGSYALVAVGYAGFHIPDSVKPGLPALAFVSILWTAWDPTYGSLKRAEYQGRTVRQQGKREYNTLQVIAWLSRCCTSLLLAMSRFQPEWDQLWPWTNPDSPLTRKYCIASLALELIILARCFTTLRLERPPPVRLTEAASQGKQSLASVTSAPTSHGATPAIEPDLLAPLSLSSKPVVIPPPGSSNPIFGMPSFVANPTAAMSGYGPDNNPFEDSAMDVEDDNEAGSRRRDPDAMDWTPTIPSPQKQTPQDPNVQGRSHDDGSWLRPQRFFAPEEPTGLESLFSTTIKLSDDEQAAAAARSGARRGNITQWLNPIKMLRKS